MRIERLGQYIDERGRMACHYHFVPDVAPAVAALDAIDPTGDPEHAHIMLERSGISQVEGLNINDVIR